MWLCTHRWIGKRVSTQGISFFEWEFYFFKEVKKKTVKWSRKLTFIERKKLDFKNWIGFNWDENVYVRILIMELKLFFLLLSFEKEISMDLDNRYRTLYRALTQKIKRKTFFFYSLIKHSPDILCFENVWAGSFLEKISL